MRKFILYCAAVVAPILAYGAWPLLGAYQLAEAARSGSPEAVLERVDVDSVRRHLVHQILDPVVVEREASRRMGSVGRGLAAVGAAAVIDARLAELFPPEEIARLIMTGRVSRQRSSTAGQVPALPPLGQIAEAPLRSIYGWNYISLTKFRIAAGDEASPGEPIWLTFRLQDLSWQLWRVELPQSIVKQIRLALEAKLASSG
ncbi:MAG TPA: DUF2939 domain-containing protein [Afifellaceae bacterium]|nr:DUF2939 domain-containing protein [Afifellaceae bacterium]